MPLIAPKLPPADQAELRRRAAAVLAAEEAANAAAGAAATARMAARRGASIPAAPDRAAAPIVRLTPHGYAPAYPAVPTRSDRGAPKAAEPKPGYEITGKHPRKAPDLASRVCPVCHTTFAPTAGNQVYCKRTIDGVADACRVRATESGNRARNRRAADGAPRQAVQAVFRYKQCLHCGASFVPKTPGQAYDTAECAETRGLAPHASGRWRAAEHRANVVSVDASGQVTTLDEAEALGALAGGRFAGGVGGFTIAKAQHRAPEAPKTRTSAGTTAGYDEALERETRRLAGGL